MLKRNYLSIIASVCLSVIVVQFQSCKKEEIPLYEYENCLFFDKFDADKVKIDTAYYSFSYNPMQEVLVHNFKISLIGSVLTEDTEYAVQVVEGKDADDKPYTTAKPGQYTLPEKLIFRKGVSSDSLAISMVKAKVAKDEEVYVTIRLIANENFNLGYWDYRDVKLTFNNKVVQPLWWTKEITVAIFGVYSIKKLETIMLANPTFTSTEEMNLAQKMNVAKITIKYILENNVTEEDGSPMTFPIY